MALVTLQTIFQDAFLAYEQRHALPAHVRRAARAVMQCRTAALGGHVQACPDGHMARIWYNSCRHRACPQCAYLQTERWLAFQQARLLACDHYHVIFTLLHDLNPLWLANVPVMSMLLFQAVRDTLFDLLADPKYLGAQPGILMALHTWSQTLMLHPHVHCLVTGGGHTPDGAWKAVRNGFLLPARVVMAVFRGKMLAAIRQAWAHGMVTLPAALRPQQWLNLLHRLGHPTQTKWNVRIMERYRHGAGVVTYVARYLRGGPLKNARLVAYDGACVTFAYRARQEEVDAGPASSQRMTLPVADFLQRWLLHVPVPQTRVVRCYGLYHLPPLRPWRSAARRWGKCWWRFLRVWTGRRRVPSGATRTRNGVLPAGNGSSASRSSPGRPPHRRCRQRYEPHESHTGRKNLREVGCAWCQAGGGCKRLWHGGRTPWGRGMCLPEPPTGLRVGVPVQMPVASPGIISIACASEKTCAGRIGTRSVQPRVKLHLAVGGKGRGRDSVTARRNLTPNA